MQDVACRFQRFKDDTRFCGQRCRQRCRQIQSWGAGFDVAPPRGRAGVGGGLLLWSVLRLRVALVRRGAGAMSPTAGRRSAAASPACLRRRRLSACSGGAARRARRCARSACATGRCSGRERAVRHRHGRGLAGLQPSRRRLASSRAVASAVRGAPASASGAGGLKPIRVVARGATDQRRSAAAQAQRADDLMGPDCRGEGEQTARDEFDQRSVPSWPRIWTPFSAEMVSVSPLTCPAVLASPSGRSRTLTRSGQGPRPPGSGALPGPGGRRGRRRRPLCRRHRSAARGSDSRCALAAGAHSRARSPGSALPGAGAEQRMRPALGLPWVSSSSCQPEGRGGIDRPGAGRGDLEQEARLVRRVRCGRVSHHCPGGDPRSRAQRCGADPSRARGPSAGVGPLRRVRALENSAQVSIGVDVAIGVA